MLLLSTAYFPPIEYFAQIAKYSISASGPSAVMLESKENYIKQSYRNRCRILTSNGVEDLRVPIIHDGARLVTDIKVDYSTDWVRRTEYAIDSAYYSSPFFEYYRDQLFAILDSHPATLWDLNLSLIRFFCSKIGLPSEFEFSAEYLPSSQIDGSEHCDLRDSIHPKKPSSYQGKAYWQVFKEKYGFVANLSIMDLLFNEGPESICYL